MFDSNSFKDKNILVTGAGSGIGRATVLLMASLGAHILMVGRDFEKLKKVSLNLPEKSFELISFDLCNFDSYNDLFNQCIQNGKLDGLVHCAGIARAIPLRAISVSSIDNVFDINFKTFAMLVKFFAKKKISNDGASIVSCSAINVHYPQKCMSIYEASKGAIEVFVRGLAEELYNERKQRINSLIIGPVVTPMAGFAIGDISAVGTMSEVTPNLMGMADPASIANMIAFLLSESSNYTTGRKFYVDGGRF